MSNYSNVLEDTIFPSFIISCVPDVDLEELKKESYNIKNKHPSKNVSNQGGYQSPAFKDDEIEESEFKKLNQIIVKFCQDIVKNKNLTIKFKKSSWWININKSHHYNVIHSHGPTDLIGVFYITLPQNSGNLTLVRKDGMEYTNLYKNNEHNMMQVDFGAQPGRLYIIPGSIWHYVTSGENNDDRISVSYNINFE